MKQKKHQEVNTMSIFYAALRRDMPHSKEDEKHIHKMNTKDREKNRHKVIAPFI